MNKGRQLSFDELCVIFKAMEFAAQKHRDQRRKDINETPYINHPIQLAEFLVNEAQVYDVTVLVAALLHDTLEDTNTSYEELAAEFGKEIADIVLEVSDDKSLSKKERKQLQIKHAATASEKAKLVKLADKICNLRDMGVHPPADWSIDRKREYFDWAKEVIDQIRGVNEDIEAIFDRQYQKRP